MLPNISPYLKGLEMKPEASFENMTVFPLIHDNGPGVSYLTLDEALDLRVIEVTEVSESGEVSNLLVTNKDEIPILILAGEELVGAKQNRLVNATFLVAGLSKLTVPVSCVEQGRWHYQEREFKSEKRISSPQLRSKVQKDVSFSVRERRGYRANQFRVWEDIATKSARLQVHSDTLAMAALYESYDDHLKDYTTQFPRLSGQTGFLAAINGSLAGLELFDSPDHLAKYFDKLIRSYALDALDLKRQKPRPTAQAGKEQAESWVTEVKNAPVAAYPSLGLGMDLRLEGQGFVGSGLLHDETLVYLSVFARAAGGERQGSGSRMARASRRGFYR
ncbi:MAG: ARPP-1 family domain-containing protein [Desulfobaccales bacterium]